MSAHVEFADPSARVAWLTFDGSKDELEANLRAYGIRYAIGLSRNRMGICYRRNMDTIDMHSFMDATVALIDLFTARKDITKKDQERFIAELQTVQRYQPEEEVFS